MGVGAGGAGNLQQREQGGGGVGVIMGVINQRGKRGNWGGGRWGWGRVGNGGKGRRKG